MSEKFDELVDRFGSSCEVFAGMRLAGDMVGTPANEDANRLAANSQKEKTRAALVEYVAGLEAEVERLREAARWIPVEERLPENNNAVLVTDGGHSVVEGSYVLGRWVAFSEGRYIHPTHWRPLPEPPEAA